MRIIDLQRRLHEVGRIRIGEQVATAGGRSRPAKLEVFRLTSRDRTVVDAAAARFGGTVEPWDAPDGPQWQVKTTSVEMPVIVPPGDMAFSQAYEQWTAGGCKVRCDGRWDHQGDKACHCNPEDRACSIHTRLSVMLPDLPGVGVWRLDTSGYYAAVELGGVVDLAAGYAARGQMLPARLRLEQRTVKRQKPDGKAETRRFAVPVLNLDVHPLTLAGGSETPVAIEAGASFQPVPADLATPPAASVADQVKELGDGGKAPRARKNAATPIPGTGARPRTAAQAAADAEVAPPVIPPKSAPPAPAAIPDGPEFDVDGDGQGDDAPAGEIDLPATLQQAGIAPAKFLRVARRIAKECGEPQPTAVEEITDPTLIRAVLEDLGLTPATGSTPVGLASGEATPGRNQKMWAMVAEAWPDDRDEGRDELRRTVIGVVSGGRTESSKTLNAGEWDDLFSALEAIKDGTQELHLRATGDWELRHAHGRAS